MRRERGITAELWMTFAHGTTNNTKRLRCDVVPYRHVERLRFGMGWILRDFASSVASLVLSAAILREESAVRFMA